MQLNVAREVAALKRMTVKELRGRYLEVFGEEARVREIFELYLHHRSLIPTVRELDRRGWRTKEWTTRKGKCRLRAAGFTITSAGSVLHHRPACPANPAAST